MDRVKDESPPMEKRAISFIREEDEVDAEMAESQSDLQTIDWDKHPPVAELKIDTSYLKRRNLSERSKKCFHIVSVVTVLLVVCLFWFMMLIPQLCYFHVGICQEDTTSTTTVSRL